MKNLVFVLSLVIGAWMVSPTPVAQAWSWSSSDHNGYKFRKVKKPGGGGVGVPELDPSAAGGAMVLLLGGVAFIASRWQEEDLL